MANLNDVIERLKAEGDLNRNSGTNSNKVIINEIDLTNVTLKRIANSMQAILNTMVEKSVVSSASTEKSDDESDPNEIIQERSAKIDDERDENELLDVVKNIRDLMETSDDRRLRENAEDSRNTKEPKTAKEVRKMSEMFKGFMKYAILGLGANILGGTGAGPVLLGLGLATGNSALMAIGGMAILIDRIINGNLFEEIGKLLRGETTLSGAIQNIFDDYVADITNELKLLYDALPTGLQTTIDLLITASKFLITAASGIIDLVFAGRKDTVRMRMTNQAISDLTGRNINLSSARMEDQISYYEARAIMANAGLQDTDLYRDIMAAINLGGGSSPLDSLRGNLLATALQEKFNSIALGDLPDYSSLNPRLESMAPTVNRVDAGLDRSMTDDEMKNELIAAALENGILPTGLMGSVFANVHRFRVDQRPGYLNNSIEEMAAQQGSNTVVVDNSTSGSGNNNYYFQPGGSMTPLDQNTLQNILADVASEFRS